MANGATVIEVVRGDITGLAVDALVNAANSTLLGGGGVDGAIHRAGGPEILAACRAVRRDRYPGGLPVGEAVATTAGRLSARWVIHTVGPVYTGRPPDAELLAACYRSSLGLAASLGATSIAFPTISAGVYGYPIEDATLIAVETVRATGIGPMRVLLVAYTSAAETGYRAALGIG